MMKTWGWRDHWNAWGFVFAPVMLVLAVPFMMAYAIYVLPVMAFHEHFTTPIPDRDVATLALGITMGFIGLVVTVGGIAYLATWL